MGEVSSFRVCHIVVTESLFPVIQFFWLGAWTIFMAVDFRRENKRRDER